jgi:hypothetical protein
VTAVTLRRSATFLLVVVALALAAPEAEAQPPPASYSCTPTPGDCTGWRTTDVVLRWFAPTAVDTNNCPIAVTLTAEGVTNWDCGVTADTINWVWARATVSIDKTVPTVTGATPSRPPDANGWYRSPVDVAFFGTDAISGIRSCTAATYSTPDSRTASLTGTCTDVAGNSSAPSGFPLRYDATGPTVTSGKPARDPDHGRWYRRPVDWRFKGTDALSGLAECPPVLYNGPDGRAARVVGACGDRAGNISTRSFTIPYDATPPARPVVRAVARDHAVKLRIRVTSDVRSITIVRAPGRGGTRDSTIYRGRPKGFTDLHARNGTRYRYTVVARDRAAHRSRRSVSATPRPRLLAPADGAVLYAPPRLTWTPVRHAAYFNVQLRRDGRKVLSRWPSRARLQLRSRWRFEGRVRRLVPGRYEWDVWPGFGERKEGRYGARIGDRSFVIPEAPAGG